MTYERLGIDVILFISVIVAPWWCPLLIGIILATRVIPYEILFAGFLLDLLYGSFQPSFLRIPLPIEIAPYAFTVLGALIFFVSVFMKRFLIFYNEYPS